VTARTLAVLRPDQLHVVERFKLIDDGTFTTKWSALQRFRLAEQRPLLEDVCAEDNFRVFRLQRSAPAS
jgi:hypothetical protein